MKLRRLPCARGESFSRMWRKFHNWELDGLVNNGILLRRKFQHVELLADKKAQEYIHQEMAKITRALDFMESLQDINVDIDIDDIL